MHVDRPRLRLKYLSDILCDVNSKTNKCAFPLRRGFIQLVALLQPLFSTMYYAKHVWREFGDKVAVVIRVVCLSIKALFIATPENVSTMNNWWLLVAYHINCQLSHSEPWASISNLAYPPWLPIDMKDAPWLPVKGFQGITRQQTNALWNMQRRETFGPDHN